MNAATNRSSMHLPHEQCRDLSMFPRAIRDLYEMNCAASRKFVSQEAERTAYLASHLFKKELKECIDDRTLDAHTALGMLVGIPEFFRSAGGMSDLGSHSHARRCLDSVRKAKHIEVNGQPHPMKVLRLNTAHHSVSMPSTASCAAFKHNTKKAVRFMQRSAEELNFAFAGDIVAVPCLLDTDWDAHTFFGPNGQLDVRDLVHHAKMQNGSSTTYVIDRLRQIFPMSWEPLAKMEAPYREAFHVELAEMVIANLAYVREVLASHRPVEVLDHQGEIVFVGRHADWIERHNRVFLIDDTDKHTRVQTGFEIALRYVSKNVIMSAIAREDPDWVVPVVINIPHDDDDLPLTVVYTRRRELMLRQKLERNAAHIVEWLRSHLGAAVPEWLDRQLKDFASRVYFAKSVSHRKTRLFVPFS